MLIDRIALVLVIIGGLNWGSVGLFKFDIVAYLFRHKTKHASFFIGVPVIILVQAALLYLFL